MFVILSALLVGGLIGMAIGAWRVADNVRRSPHGCLACGRPWHHLEESPQGRAHVQRIDRDPTVAIELPQERGIHE